MQGYPTLKWFVDGEAKEYSGGRQACATEPLFDPSCGSGLQAHSIFADLLCELLKSDKLLAVKQQQYEVTISYAIKWLADARIV